MTARKVKEIKDEMTAMFVADVNIQAKYGLAAGKTFDEQFSKVSVESIFFYIFAFCAWTVETLFDFHKREITELINELKPHSLRWYVGRAKLFMYGKALVADSDGYDLSGLTDEQIEAMRPVKYAAAIEKAGIVYLKITGEGRTPVSPDEHAGFLAYIKEIKDAGTVIEVINVPADYFRLQITIYYDPMVLNNAGIAPDGTTPVENTIRRFIENLPFNGEYRNAALVDALQAVEGVVIPESELAETSRNGTEWIPVEAKYNPYSGYCKIYDDADLRISYVPYETISS